MTASPPPVAIHRHVFDDGNPLAERNTRRALWLTVSMMVVQIVAGYLFNSMALLADGWHMSSHSLALGLSVFAYAAARRFAGDRRFAFGTWKIEILGGYTSALFLVGVAALMVVQSIARLVSPAPIHYDEAIVVAAIGLAVNLVCAWLLRGADHGHGHGHDHGHDHDHDHRHGHRRDADHRHGTGNDHDQDHDHDGHDDDRAAGHGDLNLRAAYVHVLADAATSILAIVALFGGKWWGAQWLDPVMGLIGAVLVVAWAHGLLRATARVLLDAEMDEPIVGEIHDTVTGGGAPVEIADLHVWRVGRGRYACLLAVDAGAGLTAAWFHRRLARHPELVHVTVEVRPRRS